MTLDTNAGDTSTPYMRASSERVLRVDSPGHRGQRCWQHPSESETGLLFGSGVSLFFGAEGKASVAGRTVFCL